MKKYAFGTDLGATTIKIGLFETNGRLIEKWEIPTRTEENGKYILGDIAASVASKCEDKGIGREEVEGIGIGVPGPVLENGTVVKCVNLGWGVFNVEKELESLTGWRVKACNDANLAAVGEMWQGGGRGCENMVMVTIGSGIGGGVIVNGRMMYGHHGAAGEIGHMKISKNETEVCGCGKKGCLEQYVSANGIARVAAKILSSDDEPSSLRAYDCVTAKNVFDEAKAGDKVALDLVDFFGQTLGTALSYVSCVADPEVFVIGGGVSKAGNIVIDTVQKYYKQAAFHASRETKFCLAKLGNDAGIYGGAFLITRTDS